MDQDHEKVLSLVEGVLFARIQLVIATLGAKELIKLSGQCGSPGGVGMLSVLQEAVIEFPEGLAEVLQEGEVVRKAWDQGLVMTKFMDPTQGQLEGQPVELGGIVTEQEANNGIAALRLVGCNG